MEKTIKFFFLGLFFLLSFLFFLTTYKPELNFISKIIYYLGLVLSLHIILKNANLTSGKVQQRLIVFLFFSCSFFLVAEKIKAFPLLSEINTNPGMTLFYLYLVFCIVTKIPLRVTMLFVLISFFQVLILSLGSYTFSAEVFATFAFSTIFVIIIQELQILKSNLSV